jgi:uncharacterized membrane-anchored protein YitT (DUF2179 family)
MNEIGWRPPTAPKRVSRPRISARSVAWRCVLGVCWLGAIALAALGALANRPQYADVRSGAWIYLVAFNLPAVVVALVFIRTPLVLAFTAVGAAAIAALLSWTTMRDTSSTAALGVLTAALFPGVIVAIGLGVDFATRATRHRSDLVS